MTTSTAFDEPQQNLEPLELPTAARRALVQALIQRHLNGNYRANAASLAELVTLRDDDLLEILLGYEGDGDGEICKALAQAGFSEHRFFALLPASADAPGLASSAMQVGLSVRQLCRYEAELTVLKGLEDFRSLQMQLPAPSALCVDRAASLHLKDARVIETTAILAFDGKGEPTIQFQAFLAMPGRFDEKFTTTPLGLMPLRHQLVMSAGRVDEINAIPESRLSALQWVRQDEESMSSSDGWSAMSPSIR